MIRFQIVLLKKVIRHFITLTMVNLFLILEESVSLEKLKELLRNFVNNKNTEFTEMNFVQDAYKSLSINGVNIYDKQAKSVWQQAWDLADWTPLTFPPFEKPSEFVKKNILISAKLISKNKAESLGYL